MSLSAACQPLSPPLSAEEWQAYVQSLYQQVEAERMDRRVGAYIEHRTLGQARMTLVAAGSMVLRANAESHGGVMAMMLCLEGRVALSQGRRVAELKPGDWIVIDSNLPSKLEIPGRFKQLIVEMPRALWPESLRKQMTMWAREADDPTASAAYATAVHLWRANHMLDRTRTGDAIRGLMSLMHLRPRSADRTRETMVVRAEATRMIARRLSDPELSAATLAHELGVSRRQLDRMFADAGTTVDQTLWQQRLECAAHALRSPSWAEHRILDVALEFGFKSQAHFTRRFTAQFGTSPSEWRRRGQAC